MSEREEYTPTTDEVRETYERARYYLDDMPEEGDSYRAGGGEFDRAIAAHDRALREQIAREIEVEMRRHDNAQIGFSAVGDAYAHAARITRGEDQ